MVEEKLYAVHFIKFIKTDKGQDFAYAQASAWFQMLKNMGLAYRLKFEEVKKKEATDQPTVAGEPAPKAEK